MNGPARITAFAVTLAGMVLSMSGCNRLAARDQLNKGVDSYKSARYEEAIGHSRGRLQERGGQALPQLFRRAGLLDSRRPCKKKPGRNEPAGSIEARSGLSGWA